MSRHARRRGPSRLGVAVMVVITIAAGAVAGRAETWWPLGGPFVYHGQVGERVEVEPVWVTVHGARASTVLSDGIGELTSDGSWIAVDVSAAALEEPAAIAEMTLRDARGREFRQTDRSSNRMVGSDFDPLVPERGEVVFEVPGDVVGKVTLIISPNSPGRTVPRATAEIPIDVRQPADEPLTPLARDLEGQADTDGRQGAEGPLETSVNASCSQVRTGDLCVPRHQSQPGQADTDGRQGAEGPLETSVNAGCSQLRTGDLCMPRHQSQPGQADT